MNPNSGLAYIGASTAYSRGGTGAGITVAVIDTNIDPAVDELDGQLSAKSIDVIVDLNGGTRSADNIDPSGHGATVSTVLAGKKNGTGMHGVAFDATILHIRADTPGSCQNDGADEEGCTYSDSNLVKAINYAVANDAKVINMSLGGEIDNDPSLENAIRAAAAAGVLVVVSAGNDGAPPTGSEPAEGLFPNEPAHIAGQPASLGMVVAVGSIDFRNGEIAQSSNRAGNPPGNSNLRNYYILAPGVRVIAQGPDDNVAIPDAPNCSLTVTSNCNDADDEADYYLVSGTSFAAPYVSGSLALMLDAFPNLAPAQALQILLDTATDYVNSTPDPVSGEIAGVGVDSVSGVGILNLAAAFSPVGTSSVDFGAERVELGAMLAPARGAFGDWAETSGAFAGIVFQDSFDRGFRMDKAEAARGHAAFADLATRARFDRGQAHAVQAQGLSFSWFSAPPEIADPRRPWEPEPDTTFSFAMDMGAMAVAGGRGGGPSEMVAGPSLVFDPSGPSQFETGGSWASVGYDVGPMTLDVHSSSASGRSTSGVGLGAGGDDWRMRMGVSAVRDERTALGGSLQGRFGFEEGSAMTALGVEAQREFGGWTFGASIEGATAELQGFDADGVWTSAWTVGAETGLAGGMLRLAAAQPRRAEGGTLTFDAPVEVLRSGLLRYETRTAELVPSGREVDFEVSWRTRVGPRTTFETAAALATQPNHVADAEDEGAFWLGVRHAW